MNLTSLLIPFLVLLPYPVAAQNVPPPAVIEAVTQELNAGGSDMRLAKRLLKPVRIGEEIAWRADFEKAGSADWCGSGGCRVMLFAEHAATWKAVFDRQIRQFKLRGTELTVEVYGKYCGKAGNAQCQARYQWDRTDRAWVPQENSPGPFEDI